MECSCASSEAPVNRPPPSLLLSWSGTLSSSYSAVWQAPVRSHHRHIIQDESLPSAADGAGGILVFLVIWWCHQATLDNNVLEGKLGHQEGTVCVCVCVFVEVYGGSEASMWTKISGECVCLTVNHALMDINKTSHADTLWAGDGGNMGLSHNSGSNPLRSTKPGVEERSIW